MEEGMTDLRKSPRETKSALLPNDTKDDFEKIKTPGNEMKKM